MPISTSDDLTMYLISSLNSGLPRRRDCEGPLLTRLRDKDTAHILTIFVIVLKLTVTTKQMGMLGDYTPPDT